MWRNVLSTVVAGALAAGALGACGSDDESEAGAGQEARSPGRPEGSPAPGGTQTRRGAGRDGSGTTSGGETRRSAPTPPTPPPGGDVAVRYTLATNNACLQARRQGGTVRPPRKPSELRGYARRALARAGLTLAALRQRRSPPPSRPAPTRGQVAAIQGLQAEYTRLMGLYQRAAATKGSAAKVLLAAVQSSERSAGRKAAAAGLGGCAPGPL